MVDGFDVVKGEYPEEGRLTGEAEGWRYDAVMMTGSGESAMLDATAAGVKMDMAASETDNRPRANGKSSIQATHPISCLLFQQQK